MIVVGRIQKIVINSKPEVLVDENLEIVTNVVHSENNPIIKFNQLLRRKGSDDVIASAIITNISINEHSAVPTPIPYIITNSGPIAV